MLRSRVREFCIRCIFFPPALPPRPRFFTILINTAGERLHGGRVVSLATLSVMVSRLGYQWWCLGFAGIKHRGQPRKSVMDPWNLVGWVTPRQPRSRYRRHLPDLRPEKLRVRMYPWNLVGWVTPRQPRSRYRRHLPDLRSEKLRVRR